MKFNEFQENVHEMFIKILNEGLNPDDVDVIHTKSSGENILAAVYREHIVDYFKW